MGNADGNFEVISVKEFVNTNSGSLKNSDATDIKCDAYIKVQFAGTAYYIPLYDTLN
jgi:hypothetical protein